VLLVDDVATVRHSVQRMLANLGVDCELLEDGDEIREALRNPTHKFDAILLDIVMNRTKGDEICHQLRSEMHFRRPIIAMTGHTDPTDVIRYYDNGFDVVLGKPFEVDELADALVESMQRRGSTQRIKRVAARIGDSVDSKEVHLETGQAAADDGAAVPSMSASGDMRGVTVSAVNPRVAGIARPMRAGQGRLSSGEQTPGVARTLDEPLGARDKDLVGTGGGLRDDLTADEPVLGLQRGTTIGVEPGAHASLSGSGMGKRSATSAMAGSHRGMRVMPPGRVDG
jgi:CheY-like chemotaxis protein